MTMTTDHPVPVRHERKVPFLPNIVVPPEFAEREREIRHCEDALGEFVVPKQTAIDLLAEVWSSNVHGSVSLEGSPITLGAVRHITRETFVGRVDRQPDWPSQEVPNHLRAYASIDPGRSVWTLQEMQRLHRLLMEGAPPQEREEVRPGEFRTGTEPSQVVSKTDPKEVLFYTAPGTSVPEELGSLLDWVRTRSEALSPIIAAPVLFHEFESIHPFEDGNWRVGRLLFQIYLQTHGFPNARLCRVEQEVLRDSEKYYDLLAGTDHEYAKARETGGTETYRGLLDHFTKALLESYRGAVKEWGAADISKELLETARTLVAEARRHPEGFTLGEASRWVPGSSQSTISKHLNGLVKRGVLEAHGRTKARWFVYPDPLQGFLEKFPRSESPGPDGQRSPTPPDSDG